MEIIINNKLTFFVIILLNLCLLIQCQLDDIRAIKAFSCVNIVNSKYKKGENEPNIYSPIVLTCFIKITEEQAKRVISGIEEGLPALEPEEIEELTNFNSLADIPEKEIKQKSELLENTIKEFQKNRR